MKKVKVPELVLLHSRNSSNTFSIFSMNVYWELTLKTFWEEQLADQFRHFNFSSYLVIFRADQLKKPPCMTLIPMPMRLLQVSWLCPEPSVTHQRHPCAAAWPKRIYHIPFDTPVTGLFPAGTVAWENWLTLCHYVSEVFITTFAFMTVGGDMFIYL